MTTQIKQIPISEARDFTGKTLYIGLDVHKKSWTVTILTDHVEHKTFNMPPDSGALIAYVRKHFPGATVLCVYEAGFSGFWLCRQLKAAGWECLVVHPADVPTSDKEHRTKSDRVDSRKLAQTLRARQLRGVWVPTPVQQQKRSLSRYRHLLMRDLRRYKNRIKSFLMYYGIEIPEQYEKANWTWKFIEWLEALEFEHAAGKLSLQTLIKGYRFHYEQILSMARQMRAVFRKEEKQMYYLLQTIPGVGPLTAIALIAEIADIERFSNGRKLASLVGLTPHTEASGERDRVRGMTQRHNEYLRTMLVEASWQALRQDPALLRYYESLRPSMRPQKIIIKVARKLLNRIRYVMLNKKEYETGVVE
jgi:transposase